MVLLFSPLPGLVSFLLQFYVKKLLFSLFSFLCFMEFLCRSFAAFLISFLFLCREKVVLCLFFGFFRIKGNKKESLAYLFVFVFLFLWAFFSFSCFFYFFFSSSFWCFFCMRGLSFFCFLCARFFLSSFFFLALFSFSFFMQKEIQKIFRNGFKKGRKGKKVCEFEMKREFLFVFNLLRNSKSMGNGKAY